MIVPVTAVFVAGSIRSIYISLRQKRHKRVVFSLLLILAIFLLIKAQPVFEMRSVTNLLLSRAQQDLAELQLQETQAKIERALDINPAIAGAHLLLGNISFRRGESPAALDYFRRERYIDPLNPEPLLRQCQILNLREDYRGAEEAAREVLSVDPLSWKAYSLLADSYYYRGEQEHELYASRQAIDLNPNSVKDHSNLAQYYARKGDPVMAEYHWDQVKKLKR